MYQNIYVEGSSYGPRNVKIHLWDDEKGYLNFDFEPYCYVIDPDGPHMSLYGDNLKKVSQSKLNAKTKRLLKEQYGGRAIFESDLPAETRILTDLYGDTDDPSNNHRVFFFDIEVSMEGELPDTKTGNNPITSIAYWNKATGYSAVLILDPEGKIEHMEKDGVEIFSYDTEEELLDDFLIQWREADPTIITHWNGDYFDVPYLYRRMERVLGKSKADMLSPIGQVDYMKRRDKFLIAGISSLDYLSIYRNFTFSELDSYSLENVSQNELGRGKVEYSGKRVELDDGTTVTIRDLDDLMKYDIDTFIDYNMEDVWLIRDLDKKFDYIELVRRIAHMGHVPYEDIYMSSRYIDGAIVSWLNKKGIKAPDVRKITNFKIKKFQPAGSSAVEMNDTIHDDIPKAGVISIRTSKSAKKKLEFVDIDDNKFILKNSLPFEINPEMDIQLEYEGAYVKEPRPGLYEWIYDLDLTSMYPSIIMSLNISPETKMGKVYDWDPKDFVRDTNNEKTYKLWTFHDSQFHNLSRNDLRDFLDRNNFSIAANGVFYRNDKRGIIPEILETWFDLRQEYKGMRKDWEGKDDEKAEYYDKLQHVHKILINSVYGVLGLPSFRFYDIDNAGAVTETGQYLIKYTSQMGDHYYNRKIGSDNEVYCVYTDTDSVHGDALIQTEEYGSIPIASLYKKIENRNNTKFLDQNARKFLFPDNFKALYAENHRVARMGNIDYIEKHKVKKKMYKITTENGKSVKVTEDHSVMVLNSRNTLIERKPTELNPGDKILTIKG